MASVENQRDSVPLVLIGEAPSDRTHLSVSCAQELQQSRQVSTEAGTVHADLPAQCAQQILRAMDQAYDNWWNPQHPADAPALRKRGATLSVSFPGQALSLIHI